MPKLYAVSGTALRKTDFGFQCAGFPGVTVRENKEEAAGAAGIMVKEQFPESEGYYSHASAVMEVHNDILNLVMPQLNQKEES